MILDDESRLLRFYTDDDGYIQVLQNGRSDADVLDVKLFYFYETKPIDTTDVWEQWLNHDLIKSTYTIENYQYQKVWENTKPVAMT